MRAVPGLQINNGGWGSVPKFRKIHVFYDKIQENLNNTLFFQDIHVS